VHAERCFAIVAFKDEAQRDAGLRVDPATGLPTGTLAYGGATLRIKFDETELTKARQAAEAVPPSASVVNALWGEYQRHRFTALDAQGAGRGAAAGWESLPDPELDGDPALCDASVVATVRHAAGGAAARQFQFGP
jgi:hypothetical protein